MFSKGEKHTYALARAHTHIFNYLYDEMVFVNVYVSVFLHINAYASVTVLYVAGDFN